MILVRREEGWQNRNEEHARVFSTASHLPIT
jgi:hypothetical protein